MIFSSLRSSLNDVVTPSEVVSLCETALSEVGELEAAFASFVEATISLVTQRAATIDRDGPFAREDEEAFVNELKDAVEEFTFTLGK